MRNRKPVSQGTTTGSYFGIEQKGQAILYVFDVSLSMRQLMEGGGGPGSGPGGGRGRGGGRGQGGGRGGNGGGQAAGETRWDRCRKELHSALDKLAPRKTFNLLGFANRLRVFSNKMKKATPKNIARAHAWIDSLKLEFETNVHDALELAFYMAGRGAQDRYYEVEADTIFFLSDGAPTIPNPRARGIQRDDPKQILSAVRRWNVLGRVIIHTIGLGLRGGGMGGGMGGGRRGRGGGGAGPGGPAGTRNFMSKLAAQNGGKFIEPR
jgi:hypothetical protein